MAGKNIIVEPLVPALDVNEACQCRGMWLEEGCGTTELLPSHDSSGDQIMRVGTPFGHIEEACAEKKQVVIDQERTVVHLHKEIFRGVVVEKIGGNARTLRHPVQPKSPAGAVNMIAADF